MCSSSLNPIKPQQKVSLPQNECSLPSVALPTLTRDVLPPEQHRVTGVHGAEVNISLPALTEFTG